MEQCDSPKGDARASDNTWTEKELRWGIWGVPESELGLLTSVPQAADVIELGCGTASVSSWLVRGGFRPVAVDVSRTQLDVAARLQAELGLFLLIHANAEDVPDETYSFDLAISEYRAGLWCEPHRWLAETDRLLRSGGGLIFVTNSPLLMTCTPEGASAQVTGCSATTSRAPCASTWAASSSFTSRTGTGSSS